MLLNFKNTLILKYLTSISLKFNDSILKFTRIIENKLMYKYIADVLKFKYN